MRRTCRAFATTRLVPAILTHDGYSSEYANARQYRSVAVSSMYTSRVAHQPVASDQVSPTGTVKTASGPATLVVTGADGGGATGTRTITASARS